MKKFFKAIKRVLFPPDFTCDICGRETFNTNLCDDCLKSVVFNDGETCPVCGRRTHRPEICIECKQKLPVFKRAVSPLSYEGGGIKLIHKYKSGKAYLKEYFADLIAKKLTAFDGIDCIAYVPMTKKSQRKRGYNQCYLLAKALSEMVGVPVIKDGLIKIRDTSVQKGLTRSEREENLKGVFAVPDRTVFKDKTVLVIDDVLTTGCTADEACKKVYAAGAKTVYFATVASVEYKIIPDAEA